jgi:probable rRNA maturation factor
MDDTTQTQDSALKPVSGGRLQADSGSDYLITVQIDPEFEARLDADALHRLAIAVLRAEAVEGPLEVGVVVTSDAEVRALNVQYLGHDYETDVISFGLSEEDDHEERTDGSPRFVAPPDRPRYLGDIAISFERAAEQAPDYGQSTAAEVATLLIHGLLHLLGYDDKTEAERSVMHARQQELLEALYNPEC